MKKIFFLFRIFFPSWRFFEDIEGTPRLFYRLDEGPWNLVSLKTKRHWWMFALNVEANFFLFQKSIIQQFSGELEDRESFDERMVSYEMVKNMVKNHVPKDQIDLYEFYQIKLISLDGSHGYLEEKDHFISPQYRLND